MLTLLAAWQLRRKMPDAHRPFRIPGGKAGLVYMIVLPAMLCAVKVYYGEPYVWRWAPWLLATGPAAYLVFRYVFRLLPSPWVPAGAAGSEKE
jgi:hypothetical protein